MRDNTSVRKAADLAVIVLAGGAGRRMGGDAKPALPVDGEPMLARVLRASAGVRIRVVVGPPGLPRPPDVGQVSEQPPGGGPVAGLAAGLDALGPAGDLPRLVAVLAGDLPFLTAGAIERLCEALTRTGAHAAFYRDAEGRRQLLCGVWWESALRAALPERVAGAPMRALVAGLAVADVEHSGATPPPWYDCDTPEDLATAETLAHQGSPAPGAAGPTDEQERR
jgi:molybdopterin-guanine dinucleotide biosynthesis protein A